MDDNNNKKDELPYQIPGVIIPEQVTDSGKVVGTSDTKDTLKDIKNTEIYWYLTYLQFFLVYFVAFLIFSLTKYLIYNKKLKACVKSIKIRSRESKNQ